MTNIINNKKHVILRKDVVSNQMRPSNELIRIVKNKNGEVFIDETKKANGRGVYVSPKLENIEIIKEKRLLEKNLKGKVPEQIFIDLKNEITNNWD